MVSKNRKRGIVGSSGKVTLALPSTHLFVLGDDGKTVVPTSSIDAWAEARQDVWKRKVANDDFDIWNEATGNTSEFNVSTVFTGLAVCRDGENPELFETLLTRRDLDKKGRQTAEESSQWRWRTWEEAAAEHEEIIKAIVCSALGVELVLTVLDCYRPEGIEATGFSEGARLVISLPLDSIRNLLASRIIRS